MIGVSDRIRYFLKSPTFGKITIPEPIGWDNDDKELMRSEANEGVIKKLSDSLSFHGEAVDTLQSAYENFGIKAQVGFERQYRNEQTDVWEVDYTGWLDFSTYQRTETTVNLKVNENRFLKNIESRFKEKLELDRLTDLNGNEIEPLQYVNLVLDGRGIFRESKLLNKQDLFFTTGDDNKQNEFWSIVPSQLVYKSDSNFFAPAISIQSDGYVNVFGRKIDYTGTTPNIVNLRPNSGQVFFLNALEEVSMNITVKIKVSAIRQGVSFPMIFCLSRHQINENIPTQIDFLDIQVLSEFVVQGNVWTSHEFEWSGSVTIPVRGCLCLSSRNSGITTQHSVRYELSELLVERTEPSKQTNCQALRVDTALSRLFRIVTGMDTYFSNILNTKWRDLLITSGALIRNLTDAKITISLEELLGGLNAIDDIIFRIENETVVVDSLESIYLNNVIEIGQLSNIQRTIIEGLHYSEIEIGYDFNGEYEEVMGLDEPNIKNRYTTPIDIIENKSTNVSKVLADAYGITLAQLKPFSNFPNEDTKYDKNNYFIDAKNRDGIYVVRLWQDDFQTEPTGIFSPETAFNLRLSPFNSLIRKGRSLSVGFQKYQSERIVYASTEGNSELVTDFPERANEPVSILDRPFILPEQIDGVCEMSLSLFSQISKNKYNLLKFVNERGNFEFGYIKSVKLNGNTANVQLLKANR